MNKAAKIALGAVVGGCVGFAVGYILEKKPWHKEDQQPVEEESVEESAEVPMVKEEVKELMDKIVETLDYIPSNGGNWRECDEAFYKNSEFDGGEYLYFKEDEVLAGPVDKLPDLLPDEVDDPELFDLVYKKADMDQVYFVNVGLGEKVHVVITTDDYAEAYNHWVDATMDAMPGYPMEE